MYGSLLQGTLNKLLAVKANVLVYYCFVELFLLILSQAYLGLNCGHIVPSLNRLSWHVESIIDIFIRSSDYLTGLTGYHTAQPLPIPMLLFQSN